MEGNKKKRKAKRKKGYPQITQIRADYLIGLLRGKAEWGDKRSGGFVLDWAF